MGFGHRLRNSFRQIFRITFRSPSLHPLRDSRDLILGKRHIVLKIAEPFDSAPGRHSPAQDLIANRLGPWAGILIARKRHGSRAALAMTPKTASVNDAGDLGTPGELSGDYVVRRNREGS